MFYNQYIFNQRSDPLSRLEGLQKRKSGVESPSASRGQTGNLKEKNRPGRTNRHGRLESVSASKAHLPVSSGQPFPVCPEQTFVLNYKSVF